MHIPRFNILLSERECVGEHKKVVEAIRTIYPNYSTKLVFLSEEETLMEVFSDLQKLIV